MKLPENFVKRLYAELPKEAEALLAKITEAQPPVSIRLNARKSGLIDLPLGEKVAWTESGWYLTERPVFTLDPAFHAGAYYVQEASSMLLEYVVKQLPDIQSILDLCAAPGGKSTLLASCLPEDGVLVANEILPNRAAVLAENLTKWGDERVVVTNNKPADFLKTALRFDLVVCDAPCSGEGLFRRDPEAMREWSANSPDKCAARQQDIVAAAAQLVKPGGYFIYSTCTYAVAENEAIVHGLIALGWLPKTISIDAEWGFMDAVDLGLTAYPATMFRAMPHRIKGEGFFLAVLQRPNDLETRLHAKLKTPVFRTTEPNVPFYDVSILSKYIVARIKENHFAWTPAIQEIFERSGGKLHFIKTGIKLGKWQGSVFVPDHEAAMLSTHITDVPVINLAREEALWYLSRLSFYIRQAAPGWSIVAFEGHYLGWIQQLPNESRNVYPNAWRIRMSLPV